MGLVQGTRLGPYEITGQIGVGGMGEVYRATDSNLKRSVAIKVLPDAFACDVERLARFQREAEVLASLNHTNIAAIYGLERADGTTALVMELVEGPTLADRIAVARIAVDEALPIARQIAEALEAAHEHGIVHRDLKPANIKLRGDGTVKVLDFGLAKALEPAGATSVGVALSPTITSPALMTGAGMLLGTAAYMSPEQARGKPVDKRADLWAFGCVLYEMLSGRQAFEGDEVTDVLARVIEREPDLTALPANTPAAIRRLLRRCLEKDRKRRLADAADARLEIDDALMSPPRDGQPDAPPAPPARRAWIERLAWSLVGLALVATIAWLLWRPLVSTGPTRMTIAVPPALALQGGGGDRLVAISPDGRTVAFVGTSAGSTQIYLRRADQFDAVPIRGTEGGVDPFFSPDGQWLGYIGGALPGGGTIPVAQGKLKKVPIGGGPPTTLSDATNRGGSWGPDGTIVFAASPTGGLYRVSAVGGAAEPLTKLEPTERSHRWPSFLPGGRAILFSIQPNGASFDDALIAVRSLDTGEQRVVGQSGASPVYLPTGHIVFGRAGTVLAMPFDLRRLEVTGPPVPLLEGVAMNTATGAGQYAIAAGSLVYVPGAGSETRRELLWVDRKGVARPVDAEKRPYADVALSPDGQRIAIAVTGQNTDLWVYEIALGALRRLTFSPDLDTSPIWTPDGRHVTFNGIRTTRSMEIFQMSFDGSGSEERLIDAGALNTQARSWHPSAKWLAYDLAGDVYVLPMDDRKPKPFLATPFVEAFPAFSPDGRWVAYQSNESGRFEVYVQPFPGPGGKWQVSTVGGVRPRWSPKGRELFFRSGGRMMAAPIEPGLTFTSGTAQVLFEGQFAPTYDVTADGRFLMVRDEQQADPMQLRFVLNWFEELKRAAPPN
jgi:eukaryotic-like serine/threonine-protein kinase